MEMVEIHSSEAAARGLPRASLALDPGRAGLVARTFPGPGTYVVLSGPPGGPLGARLEAYAGTAGDRAALEALARARFAEDAPEIGTFAPVELAGAPRAALTCVTGTSHARAAHLLALLPATPEGDGGVLLDAWTARRQPGAPAPAELLEAAPLRELLASLRVRFE